MRKNFGAKPFLFPQPVMIIGTYDENGKANAMNAAWGGIVGTDEIMIDLSSHKTTDNIMRNKAFTVSVGDVEHMVACDYVGLVSANKEDRKMEKAGFTTTESSFVHAPIINELPLTLECELLEVIGGSKYLGKIVNVSIDERVLGDDGQLSLEKFSPITYDTVHYGYYRLGERVGNAFKDGTALILMRAAKIAVGSSAAIYIAQHLALENAASAGTITLLTLVTTKWETLKLSLFRLITFALSVFLAAVTIGFLESEWIAYGIYIFVLISVCHSLGWQATVSVNSVIGIHFLTSKDFSTAFLLNEFLLVLIGITIAVILNLFYDYSHQKNGLVKSMRDTEKRLQMILGGLAAYLSGKEMQHDIWSEMRQMEQDLMEYIREACEYQDNTFRSHEEYYIDYFEMRLNQLGILHNLHSESKKIRQMPRQAEIIAYYILYMMDYVVEVNSPEAQLEKLDRIFARMKKEQLPQTREEFEARAVLYHMLMDLEEFLIYKKRFVEKLDKKQLKRYWKLDKASIN